MFDLVTFASGLVVAFFGLLSYFRYRDAFHPAVFTAPLMLAGYCIWPLILNREGDLEFLLGSEDLIRIQWYYFVALLTFYIGLSVPVKKRLLPGSSLSPWQELARTVGGEKRRKRLLKLAIFLGGAASVAYWLMIGNVGGFDNAYSRFKGGGVATSGYIGEAALLAYPATMIYALYRQGRGFRVSDWILIFLLISPNLLHGVFGVRRGPLFISLATLLVSWVIARGRVPGLIRTGLGVGAVLASVVYMWTQRRVWFTDDGTLSSQEGIASTILPDSDALWQNDYVSGVGSALITEYYNAFFWGKRWFVDMVIRPIPRQFWPTKYEDVGAFWKDSGNPTGFDDFEQIQVLGFPLPRGHSMGVLSDLYSEWWWWAIAFTFLLGLFLRLLWYRHRAIGQVWTAIFLAAMGLCIYLPTQSFSAWYQRFLIMAVVTFVGWRWVIGEDLRQGKAGRRRSAPPLSSNRQRVE